MLLSYFPCHLSFFLALGISLSTIMLVGCGAGNDPAPGSGSAVDMPGDLISGDCVLSAEDKAMLAAVNAARAQDQQCGDRQMKATSGLRWSCKLAAAAAAHSKDMATINFFDHTGSDGSNFSERAERQGYQLRSGGENIAAGQSSVEVVMEGWLESSGHCSNIMSSNYTEFGSGKVEDSGSDFRIYWTQVFGKPG